MFADPCAALHDLANQVRQLICLLDETFGASGFVDQASNPPLPMPAKVAQLELFPQAKSAIDGDVPRSVPNYALRENWAIFVGANVYDDQANYPLIEVCASDATALADQFVANGFAREHTHVITDTHPDNLPTRRNIINTLNVLAALTKPDDLLLFYYSGHGDIDMGGQESYLIARDGIAASLQDTAVPFQRVKEIMQRAPARNKVIILDTCHAGAAFEQKGRKRMPPAFISRVFEQAEGLAILASCTGNQLSYQATSLGQSAATSKTLNPHTRTFHTSQKNRNVESHLLFIFINML